MAFKPVLEFDMMDIINQMGPSKAKALAPFVKRDSIRKEYGNRLIDRMIERTLSGKDKRNITFKGAKGKPRGKYSDQYKNSLEYQVYGKTDKVNMKLTGQMQAAINVVGLTRTGVKIGFTSGTQREKAKGHVMGAGPLPVRDFWGISKKEQEKILKGVIKDFNEENSAIQLLEAISSIPIDIFGEFELGQSGGAAVVTSSVVVE